MLIAYDSSSGNSWVCQGRSFQLSVKSKRRTEIHRNCYGEGMCEGRLGDDIGVERGSRRRQNNQSRLFALLNHMTVVKFANILHRPLSLSHIL